MAAFRYRVPFWTFLAALTVAMPFTAAARASAQTLTIDLWPGVAPGSQGWTQKETTYENTPEGTVVTNVVKPELIAFLPERSKATGSAVIVAPGGYCVALAMSAGGYDVAQWLQQRGIAAFVLKYRTMEKREPGIPRNLNMDDACQYGIADGVQAVKLVRERASEWGIARNKVGIIGFSAGAMVAAGTMLQPDAVARPDFVALLYGAPFGAMPAIPKSLPPVFMAWAQDDPLALYAVVRLFGALSSAGFKPEAHVFTSGGHGFAIKKQGKASDGWTADFYNWLQAEKFAP